MPRFNSTDLIARLKRIHQLAQDLARESERPIFTPTPAERAIAKQIKVDIEAVLKAMHE
jgi:hypothetical protein